ncbi:hypothetical protein QR680_015389 [Steinernema hermaphroditum]|uniref:DH domain-containing protein n=1 Tax=Steinernema hermaphroditum TaxID=289476 RepID=A0AA39H8G0_9BILA|nr:hypothetical protein QR680_015389 [Steinernema hermaphroditum]
MRYGVKCVQHARDVAKIAALTTELAYVRELQAVVCYYLRRFEDPENQDMIPDPIRGKSQLVFGNICDIIQFHNKHVLSEMLSSTDCAIKLCKCIVSYRNKFLELYLAYCQNKRTTDCIRQKYVDKEPFFVRCQEEAGHALPLSAYLLKPVQRITKYQLLLKELEMHCTEKQKATVQDALKTMLDLLNRLNQSINHVYIAKYPGDLALLGRFRLSNDCDVYMFNRKTCKVKKTQYRQLFLFQDALLMCKKKDDPLRKVSEYFEYKISIPMAMLKFASCSKTGKKRFEVWSEEDRNGYAIYIRSHDEMARKKWVEKLDKISRQLQSASFVTSRNTSALSSQYNCCAERFNPLESGYSCPVTPASTIASTPCAPRIFFNFGRKNHSFRTF